MSSEIGSFFQILHRRWLVLVIICVIGALVIPFLPSFLSPYKATAGLLVVSEAAKDTTETDPDLPSIVESTEVLGPVINELKLNTTILKMRKHVSTKMPPKSSILEVTYKDTDGERAALVANAIADRTAAYFHDIAGRRYDDVMASIKSQIAVTRNQIASADRRLQHESADYAFVSSDKALDDLTSQINGLSAARGQAYQSLVADEASLQSQTGSLQRIQPIVRGEILQKDPVYQQLQTQLAKDVADQTSEKASFYDSFPGLSQLTHRVERERAQVDVAKSDAVSNGAGLSLSFTSTTLNVENLRAQVAADKERVKAADQQLVQEQRHLRSVAQPGAAVGTLRAERDGAIAQYQALTQRLSQAQGDAAQAASLGTLVVVDRALAGGSSMIFYILGFTIATLAFAVMAAYIVDAIDSRFWTDSDIEKVYGRPVLLQVGDRVA